MGGSPSAMDGGAGLGQMGNDKYGPLTPTGFNWGNLFGGQANQMSPAQNPAGALDKPNPNGVGSLDWMKWHPDYQATPGTAAWGATHPDPAQNVKYGSAQWQQTHPNYQANQMVPAQLGQPPNDLSEVIKHMFGGGQ